jgi:hypothetical protein
MGVFTGWGIENARKAAERAGMRLGRRGGCWVLTCGDSLVASAGSAYAMAQIIRRLVA